MRADDLVYSTHRPVGHLIAKGVSLDAITAEIWGKATGCFGGKRRQMHLADFSVGAIVSNAIVGANIPNAAGSALAFRMLGLDRAAVSFFGDGAFNIGAFHEGVNLAVVKRAPTIFLCENNLYAASTSYLAGDEYLRHRGPRRRLWDARRGRRRHGRRGRARGHGRGGRSGETRRRSDAN